MKKYTIILLLLMFNLPIMSAMTGYYYKETGMRHKCVFDLSRTQTNTPKSKTTTVYILRYTIDVTTDSMSLTQKQWSTIEAVISRYNMMNYGQWLYRPEEGRMIRDLEDWKVKIQDGEKEAFYAGYGNFPDGVTEIRDYLWQVARKDMEKKKAKRHADGLEFTIVVDVNMEGLGMVKGEGTYAKGDTAHLEAEPYDGFIFEGWKDGEKSPQRDVVVTEDKTYMALFSVPHTDEH